MSCDDKRYASPTCPGSAHEFFFCLAFAAALAVWAIVWFEEEDLHYRNPSLCRVPFIGHSAKKALSSAECKIVFAEAKKLCPVVNYTTLACSKIVEVPK